MQSFLHKLRQFFLQSYNRTLNKFEVGIYFIKLFVPREYVNTTSRGGELIPFPQTYEKRRDIYTFLKRKNKQKYTLGTNLCHQIKHADKSYIFCCKHLCFTFTNSKGQFLLLFCSNLEYKLTGTGLKISM